MSIQIVFRVVIDDEDIVDSFSDDEYSLAERYAADFSAFVLDDNPDTEIDIVEAGHFT
jgi:hypothetical protein